MSQWFGNGFGHSGSTSNLGAITVAASTAALFSSTMLPTPKTTTSVRKIAPMQRLRFMLSSFSDVRNGFFVGKTTPLMICGILQPQRGVEEHKRTPPARALREIRALRGCQFGEL